MMMSESTQSSLLARLNAFSLAVMIPWTVLCALLALAIWGLLTVTMREVTARQLRAHLIEDVDAIEKLLEAHGAGSLSCKPSCADASQHDRVWITNTLLGGSSQGLVSSTRLVAQGGETSAATADAWDRHALTRLQSGATEVLERVELRGVPSLRLAVPVPKHPGSAYSISMDLRPFLNQRRMNLTVLHAGLTVLWALGMLGLRVGFRRFRAQLEHSVEAAEERRRLELQMLQAQKLESLGLMASGVAHDFNNLLQGMLGNASLLKVLAPQQDEVQQPLRQIVRAAERAAELSRQMLTFAGKGAPATAVVQLTELVRDMAELMQAGTTKKTRLRLQLPVELPCVRVDATQVRQVVMNLITNAADAMGEGAGEIVVETGALELDADRLQRVPWAEELRPGRFVFLRVADTGCGMAPEVMARIFDPFFSTKFTGRGLGLAAVQGIVRRHQGFLAVTSSPGQGTVFEVMFPAVADAPCAEAALPPALTIAPRRGRILLVDDDEFTLDLALRALRRAGHEVLVAADGRQALALFDAHREALDLVLLDWSMPELGGGEVLAHIRESAALPVIISSGHAEDNLGPELSGATGVRFIQKPYPFERLVEVVAEMLGPSV